MPDDPYVDPRTGVLRNRLGIADPAELARAEARLAAGREAILLHERPALGRYDLSHLQAIHRHLFGQIYDWGWPLRTVNMSKGDTLFALAEWIEPQGRQLFDDLAGREHLRDLDRDGFVTAAGSSPTSTPSTPSGKATAAPNASSSNSWPTRPAGSSPGLASPRPRTTPPRPGP